MHTPHHTPAPTARVTTAMVTVLAMLLALLVLAQSPAAGAVASGPRAFAPRFAINTAGDLTQTGNGLMTCPASDSRCTDVQAGILDVANNDFAMTHIDADADPATFNSSTADLLLPAGVEILWAGLYWGADVSAGNGGSAAADASSIGRVLLAAPGGDAYVDVPADSLDGSETGGYQGFADVTDLVMAAGSGTYAVANVQAGTGRDRYAGWALFAAYRDVDAMVRNLTVYDGFQVIGGTSQATIALQGFQTPPTGQVVTDLAVLTWEGDAAYTGDTMSLRCADCAAPADSPQLLQDESSPGDNFFNSSIADQGTPVTAREPGYQNLLAMDLDRIDASGILGNDSAAAEILLSSSGDRYMPGVVTFATELFAPNITVSTMLTPSEGGDPTPGDVVRYDITVANASPIDGRAIDAASDAVLSVSLPLVTQLVPASVVLHEPGDASPGQPLTSAPDDDRAELNDGVLTVRLGAGATTNAGGILRADEVSRVSFDVKVDEGVADGASLDPTPVARYHSSAGLPFEAGATPLTQTVVAQSERGVSVAATASDIDDAVAWEVRVHNDGPDVEPEGVLTLVLDGADTIDGTQDRCDWNGRTAACALPPLDVGESTTIAMTATLEDPAIAGDVLVRLDGANRDTDPSDDEATAALQPVLADPSPVVPEDSAKPTGAPVDNPEPSAPEEPADPDVTPGPVATPPIPTPSSDPESEGPMDESVIDPPVVDRVAGATRTQTASLVAREAYPDGCPVIVLARDDDFADALAGATIARHLNAPILLTSTSDLSDATREEIVRSGAHRVVILGGAVAVSDTVEQQVHDMGLEVDRIAGANRFETARLVAEALPEEHDRIVYVAEGAHEDASRGWPDALGASALAAFTQRPVLLVTTNRLPEETVQALQSTGASQVIIIGGTAAVDQSIGDQLTEMGLSVDRIAGDTRYATMDALHRHGIEEGLAASTVWIATGTSWPDALTIGPIVGALGQSVLFVDGQDVARSPEVLQTLRVAGAGIERIRVVGGQAAVSDEVVDAVLRASASQS